MFKKLICVFFIFLLTNCGFVPMYKNLQNIKYKIDVIELNGDRDINNLINLNLKKYSDSPSNIEFKIKVNTKYNKKIIAKDTTGKASDYQIEVKANFYVKKENISKTLNITETFEFKRKTNNFDEIEYERSIKQNMTNNIIQKLILQLSRIK